MLKIAIVGNIASGKSEAEKFLISSGYKVLDTDKTAHALLDENNRQISEAFKDFDITENGKISRLKLGKIVFGNKKLKKQLENILYPLIEEKINEFFQKNGSTTFVFAAVPQLFEAGMEHLFDKIVFIYADDNIRLKRLIKRNKYTKEYALLRMNSQQSQEDKIKKSDYIIYNNSDISDLHNQITKLLKQLGS